MWPILKREVTIFVFLALLIIFLSSISVTGQGGIFQQIKTYDNKQFKDQLIMESTFPEHVDEIKVYFFKKGIEVSNDTSKVISGKWSFKTDITNWVSGDYEAKFFAHDINGTVIDQIIITITIQSDIKEGKRPGSVFDDEFNQTYVKKIKSYTDTITIKTDAPVNVVEIYIRISKDGEVIDELTKDVSKGSWEYEKAVEKWDTGIYFVALEALDDTGEVWDSTSFQIKIKEEEEKEPFSNMPLFCAIILIIFIVLFIVLFVLSIIKHKKIMTELRFKPKSVVKKLPLMALVDMLVTFLLVIAGTSVIITAKLDLIPFLLFLAGLGLFMLVTYWTFSNRNYPNFIFYLIFGIISLTVISLAGVWSPTDAVGLVVGSGLIITALILFFISILLYWLTSRRGFLIALVTVILALAFCVIHIVFIVLSAIEFIDWWIATTVGAVLLTVMLFVSWLVLREDIFYFETRDESQTQRGWRRTLNMFDILSTPRGLFKREYDRKVMGKISYEHMHDKNIRMEVIQLREWNTNRGRAQGRRLMGVYVNKMRSKEGPMFQKDRVAKSVKYTTYSSDTNLDDKLELCKAFGFEIYDSGRERGLDYYDLDLVHKPLFGLGTPMGSEKKKKDYDKDSGYARDKGKDEKEREHRYDYEHEEERRREKREREEKAAYERQHEKDRERERDRDRARYYDEDRDREYDDWSRRDRERVRPHEREGASDRDRRRDYERSRDYDRDRSRRRERDYDDTAPARWPAAEPSHEHARPSARKTEPDKTKKRPPPPRIIAD